ncbi:hypothetical protein [Sciscionella sediminilitoris]|uniref:hypothetical protein n=1 Tax=Sciscionella sediminilitoris TaxID=1445613 RepID=UPI0012E16956|nr:hypothetical protein [Sciscionella sp. SE31]
MKRSAAPVTRARAAATHRMSRYRTVTSLASPDPESRSIVQEIIVIAVLIPVFLVLVLAGRGQHDH